MNYRLNVRNCSYLAVLVALEIILSRFCSFHTWNLKIGFSFVPVVVAAMVFGAWQAGLVAAIGDVTGAVLFPVGAYFPGFTVTALFNGVVFGLFLRRKVNMLRIVCSVLIVQVIGSLFVNTYWISVLYGTTYWPMFGTRLYQAAGMAVVQVVTIGVVKDRVVSVIKRVV